MTVAKRWSVDLFISEQDETTRAEARLHSRDATHLRGVGLARRNPHDRDVPEIGDELAAARALADLADRLRQAAVDDVERVTPRRVHPSGRSVQEARAES